MALTINRNLPAMTGAASLSSTHQALQRNLQRMSSGKRITDEVSIESVDAAAKKRLNEITQESTALQTGINMIKTAEGGMDAQMDNLMKLRTMAVQASSDTLDDEQRQAFNQEAQELLKGIDTTAEETTFNEQKLLQGVSMSLTKNNALEIAASTTETLGIETLDLTSKESAQQALTTLDDALTKLNSNRSNLGAQTNKLTSALQDNQVTQAAMTADSAIRDADTATQMTNFVRSQILTQSAVAMLSQANSLPRMAMQLIGG